MKKDLQKMFTEIESHSLDVETIICTICDNVLNFKDKTTHPCEHQKQMAESLKNG